MIYGDRSATFVCMMYQSPVSLKTDEKHCYYCRGYGIRPVNRERGQKTQYHEKCTFCDGRGK